MEHSIETLHVLGRLAPFGSPEGAGFLYLCR
jgi:hypothetical protein